MGFGDALVWWAEGGTNDEDPRPRRLHEPQATLLQHDTETAEQVGAAFDLLEELGPSLGRPLVDTLHGSRLPSLKELRPGSRGRGEVRLLIVFDPQRRAIVLVAGDKAGRWKAWYRDSIPLAEARYEEWREGGFGT